MFTNPIGTWIPFASIWLASLDREWRPVARHNHPHCRNRG
jgi:hypothetical protein